MNRLKPIYATINTSVPVCLMFIAMLACQAFCPTQAMAQEKLTIREEADHTVSSNMGDIVGTNNAGNANNNAGNNAGSDTAEPTAPTSKPVRNTGSPMFYNEDNLNDSYGIRNYDFVAFVLMETNFSKKDGNAGVAIAFGRTIKRSLIVGGGMGVGVGGTGAPHIRGAHNSYNEKNDGDPFHHCDDVVAYAPITLFGFAHYTFQPDNNISPVLMMRPGLMGRKDLMAVQEDSYYDVFDNTYVDGSKNNASFFCEINAGASFRRDSYRVFPHINYMYNSNSQFPSHHSFGVGVGFYLYI